MKTSKTLISIGGIILMSLGFLALASALAPEPASAQTYSVPIRWCVVANDTNDNGRVDPGEQGAPAFTNPGHVGEVDTDNVLWRRHERPSDTVYIPEAQITFRSGIYNIVEDPILRFPIIPDPDPNPTGDSFWQIGDIVHPNDDFSGEWNAAHNACVAAWRARGVEDIGVVVINANHVRTLSGDSEPGVAITGGRRILLRDNAYLFPGSPLYNATLFPVADHVDKHFGHEMGHALAGLRHTCNNQNLMSNRRLDPSGDKRVDNIHLSSSIAQVIDSGLDSRDCGFGNDQIINPGADDLTAVVNQIQSLRNAARLAPGCKIAGTNTDCTMRSDIHADRIREVAVRFTDLSTVTATNLSETIKLFHEPMGPLNPANFQPGDSFDYYTFIDQDRNEATGGKADDLGVTVSFKGAEFATRVRVTLVSGQRFFFRPTVWRFTGGAFVIVQDPRIIAYAFPLNAVSERGTAHLSDQITIEMPNAIFGPAINNFRLQAAVVSNTAATSSVLDILDDGLERPGKLYRWRSPTFPVCSVAPGASPRGGLIVVTSTGLLPNRPVHLIFGDRHIANGNAAADGSVSISTAIPADARGGEHLITVGTDGTALTADCTTTVITQEPPNGGRCTSCQSERRYSLSFYGGATFPHGAFNTIADSSYSLGVKPAFHFPAFGGDASLGFYFGRDNFSNPAPGGDFHLTHFSPEFEFAPTRRFCPIPSLHIGAGAYRNEIGDTAFGFNVGAGLSVCLNRRFSLLWRYDYRSVNDFSRKYSTVQGGVRFRF